MPRPFIKWAGGKSGLLTELIKYIPVYDTYWEPFLGGGAMFFALQPVKAHLSDSNGELMNAYKVVRDDLEILMKLLQEYVNEKDFYLKIRSQNPMQMSPVERAARFIYLNKTCFNGLYRVNKKNEFNVPFGNQTNPTICDKGVLRIASMTLQGIQLTATYFDHALKDAKKGDFVYMDPPYLQVKEDSFVSYSKKGFALKDHEKLADTFDELNSRGTKVMLSNSDTVWAWERYQEYKIVKVKARRSINSDGKGRGKVGELIIMNY